MAEAIIENIEQIEVLKHTLKPKVKTVKEILYNQDLKIPEYQRPYKWQPKNVKQLLEDIVLHQKKSAYRIGTAVMHKDKKELNIVDGQQRIVTLTLIAHALNSNESTQYFAKKYGGDGKLKLLSESMDNDISKANVIINYKEIEREIKSFTEDEVRFFFTKCELVCITLTSISEAFQFFDSQNARGKDLDPHDLLKAFHLREMSSFSEKERQQCIEEWESKNDDELHEVFSQYLFRIRRWSKRKNGRYLNKTNANTFKGVTLDKTQDFPYIYPLKINNVFTDEFNQHLHRKIDNNTKLYPFQIDQVVLNGQRFFEMINFYQEKIKQIKGTHSAKYFNKEEKKWVYDEDFFLGKLQFLSISSKTSISFKVFKTLATYEGRNRSGDQYVRTLFDCTLLYYTDKFGNQDLDRVITKLFIWAYRLRLDSQAVQLASVDNHAREWSSMFSVIREATQPKEVYQMYLESLNAIRSSKTEKLKDLFKSLNYYHGE
ncbi:DUF262 domain-containing protein [Lacinutrix sp. 5H-3-7-4]|uniref:DUF262 domain-containing protein n=1 Tax=Lacinutrix sp. (strain 5H-3-7-4) TaxID=983544 RepID=UPI00020A3C28|nr:DUF262 domain-containing protein [Lacinutrix sp. 5H-3-7-4]AEH01968.1 protein of unknown function DUF262 [Lacinutrix sp. 5H-3-7-4]